MNLLNYFISKPPNTPHFQWRNEGGAETNHFPLSAEGGVLSRQSLSPLKWFIPEEKIAGLEISDTSLRFALLELSDKGKITLSIKSLIEKPLGDDVIHEGVIKNRPSLIASLRRLFKEAILGTRYVIVSLPADSIYCRTFSFPPTVSEDRLEETMKLTINFQLPLKLQEVYLDWERIQSEERNEVFLAACPRSIVDSYLEVLKQVGFKPVAVESYPMSLSRVIAMPEGKATLIKVLQRTSTAVFIIKDKSIRFSRILPKSVFSEDTLREEIEKIADFYEVQDAPLWKMMDLEEASAIEALASDPRVSAKEGTKWFISLGAALRGLLPRAKDKLISLMPVGTEEAYGYQKALVFSEFFSHITIGFAVFFSVLFLGVWLLMIVLQQNFNKQFEHLSSLPPPTDVLELETRAKNLNTLLAQTEKLLTQIPTWSHFFDEVRSRVTPGILITSISVLTPEGATNMSGIAQNRNELNAFKKLLQDSPLFGEVTFPLTNLEKKENIPFSLTFKLKDPAILYQF